MFTVTRLAIAAAGLVMASSTAHAATTTYMQFFQDTADKRIAVDRVGLITTFTAANVPVDANMLAFTPGAPYVLTNLVFNFNATSNEVRNVVDGAATQSGFVGSLSFLSAGVNVLTISFDNGLASSFVGADSGNFSTGSNAGNYTATSDVFDLGQFLAGNFSLSISGLSSPVVAGDYSAVGNVSGSFAGAVPGPATWGMMLVGFGFIGYAARRRRVQTTAA